MLMRQGEAMRDDGSSLRPVIHARVVLGILNAVDIGVSHRASLLDREGLTAGDLRGLDAAVPLISYMRILDRLAGDLAQPTLGLDLADRMGPELVGAIGYVFLFSPSLDAAITAFSESVFSIQGVTALTYKRTAEPIITYTISDEALQPRRHDVEFSIGYIHRLIKLYLGGPYSPREVHFEHPAQAARSRYERIFGCPVYFEQATNALVLNAQDKERRGLNHDPHLVSILNHYMQLARPGEPGLGGVSQDVDQLLSGLVEAGNPSCRLVAARLGMSQETLRRRLKRESSSFRDILRRKRIALARRYLSETDLGILQIAQRAGYAETASFTRAFTLETGMTPTQFRRQT
jgi:AraC-like DNA-binding protein